MKRYFITGLLIWVPLGITLWVLDLLIGTMDQSLTVLPAEWQPEAWLGMRIPGLGVILTLLVIVLTGVFGANFFGQKIIDFWERQLIRIPIVKTIYGSVKQFSDTLLAGNGHAFRKVLLVHYPHPQAWSLAFQTNVPARSEAGAARGARRGIHPDHAEPGQRILFLCEKERGRRARHVGRSRLEVHRLDGRRFERSASDHPIGQAFN
jgi:uncharacterized membrane protein